MSAPSNALWIPLLGAVTLAAGALDVVPVAVLVSEPNSWVEGLSLHAVLVGALALGIWSCHRAGWLDAPADASRLAWALIITGGIALLGPLGAAAGLIGIAAHRWYLRTATPFEEWYQTLVPEQADAPGEHLYRILLRTLDRAERDSQVVPFTDVIRHGTLAQKQFAIGLMNRHYRPVFAPALRQALADTDSSVRVQAATAVASIEQRFSERAMTLEQAVKESRAAARPEGLLALAQHYDDYAFSGILDPDRERQNRDLATAAYQQYLEAKPHDRTGRTALGRLLLRRGEVCEAADCLAALPLEHEGDNAPIAWRAEALYRSQRYAELRDLARVNRTAVEDDVDFPDTFKDAVRLWAGVEVAPSG